ncbi:MAG: hypothetical protein AAFV59_14500 [Pseudomonadota bacterium]
MGVKLKTWGPALFCLTVVLVFTMAYHYRAPFHDHWALIPYYGRMQDGTLPFQDVFALSGNHWHASGIFVMLGLSKLTAMGHWAEALASGLIAGLGFFALVRIIKRTIDGMTAPSLMAWAIGVTAFLYFSLDQAGNWLWGWQISVFLNVTGALWTIDRLSCGPPTLRNIMIAILAAAMSIYAFGAGWVLIPIGWGLLLIHGALKTRRGCLAFGLWSVFATLMLWHFSLALSASAQAYTASALPTLADPATVLGLLHYTINFIASPIVRFARDISIPITILALGVAVYSMSTLRRGVAKLDWRDLSPLLALAAYAIGAGLLTALGRWELYGVKQAFVSRYITFGTLFWIAVFLLAMLAIAKTPGRPHRVMYGLLGLLFVLKIGNIPSVVQKSVRISGEIAAAAELVAADYPDVTPDQYQVLHSPLQKIEPYLDTLAAHEVSLFANRPEDAPLEDE